MILQTLLILLAVSALLVSASLGTYPNINPNTKLNTHPNTEPVTTRLPRQLPLYRINLDLPPNKRWQVVMTNYCRYTPAINAYFEQLSKNLPKPVAYLLEYLATNLDKLPEIPVDYRVEMETYSKQCDLPLGRVIILNYIYELRYFGPPTVVTNRTSSEGTGKSNFSPASDSQQSTHNTQFDPQAMGACTSIVTQDEHGYIWHARNMDWNLPNTLRNLTFRCDFYKHGQPLYSGVCFPGFIGQMTTFSASRFAVTINERLLGGRPWENLWHALTEGGWAPTHLLRHVMETETSYRGVMSALSRTKIISPAYFIVSGNETSTGNSTSHRPAQGVIITRERDSIHSVRHLYQNNSRSGDNWYILVTNYDWDSQPPARDNRRAYGLKYMNEMGQKNVSALNLHRMMSRWPVRNVNTMYTTIMSANQYVFSTGIHFA